MLGEHSPGICSQLTVVARGGFEAACVHVTVFLCGGRRAWASVSRGQLCCRPVGKRLL